MSALRSGNYTIEVIQICHVYAYSDTERKIYELSNFLTFTLSPFLFLFWLFGDLQVAGSSPGWASESSDFMALYKWDFNFNFNFNVTIA